MLTMRLLIVGFFLLMLAADGAQAGGDPVRGKEIGEWCAECHGDDGLGDEEFPAIAGMSEAEIFKALMAFKSGERVDEFEDMVENVEDLDEQDMADLAAYFSTMSAPEE